MVLIMAGYFVYAALVSVDIPFYWEPLPTSSSDWNGRISKPLGTNKFQILMQQRRFRHNPAPCQHCKGCGGKHTGKVTSPHTCRYRLNWKKVAANRLNKVQKASRLQLRKHQISSPTILMFRVHP